MTPANWKKVYEMFHAVMNHEQEKRNAFLKEACGDEEWLRQEVESLLAANDQAGNFIESSVLSDALQILADKEQLSAGHLFGGLRIVENIGYGCFGSFYMAVRGDVL
jgi:hypothetical protein